MCSFPGQEFHLGKYKFNSLFFRVLIKTLPKVEEEKMKISKKAKEERKRKKKGRGREKWRHGLMLWDYRQGQKTLDSLSHMCVLLWVSCSPSAWLWMGLIHGQLRAYTQELATREDKKASPLTLVRLVRKGPWQLTMGHILTPIPTATD